MDEKPAKKSANRTSREQRLIRFLERVRVQVPQPVFCTCCSAMLGRLWGVYRLDCPKCGAPVGGVRL
jgi:hypothetical protein